MALVLTSHRISYLVGSAHAASSHVHRLVTKLLHQYRPDDDPGKTGSPITTSVVIRHALFNAPFWECIHIRGKDFVSSVSPLLLIYRKNLARLTAAILRQLNERTASFMTDDLRALLGSNNAQSNPPILKVEDNDNSSQAAPSSANKGGGSLVNVFHFLMVMPIEYISKDLRHILARAALVTDSSLCLQSMGKNEKTNSITYKALLRTFLLRMARKLMLPHALVSHSEGPISGDHLISAYQLSEPAFLPYLCLDFDSMTEVDHLCAQTSLQLVRLIST